MYEGIAGEDTTGMGQRSSTEFQSRDFFDVLSLNVSDVEGGCGDDGAELLNKTSRVSNAK